MNLVVGFQASKGKETSQFMYGSRSTTALGAHSPCTHPRVVLTLNATRAHARSLCSSRCNAQAGVGEAVGSAVGRAVGFAVTPSAVGALLGELLGASVGAVVGVVVGVEVTPAATSFMSAVFAHFGTQPAAFTGAASLSISFLHSAKASALLILYVDSFCGMQFKMISSLHEVVHSGAGVGVAVGAAVGAAVGEAVGTAVGAVVGTTVGAVVGASVGVPVGAAVGALVGPISSHLCLSSVQSTEIA